MTDWGVGHYERTAEMLLPAARVLLDAATLRTIASAKDLEAEGRDLRANVLVADEQEMQAIVGDQTLTDSS